MTLYRWAAALALACTLFSAPLLAESSVRDLVRSSIRGNIMGFAASPKGDLYVSSSGIFRSTDKGKTWTRLKPDIDMGGVLHIDRNGTLYAAGISLYAPDGTTQLAEDEAHIALYRSTNGIDWQEIYTGKGMKAVISAVESSSDGTLFLARGTVFSSHPDAGVYRSADQGRTWAKVWDKAALSLAVAPGGILYAGHGDGISRSSDSGTTWKELEMTQLTGVIRVVAKDTLLAGTMNGLFRSTDGGAGWTSPDGVPSEMVPIPAVTPGGRIVLAVNHPLTTGDVALYFSPDKGKTWSIAAESAFKGMVDGLSATKNGIYLHTRGHGLHVSTDNGKTFKPLFPTSPSPG